MVATAIAPAALVVGAPRQPFPYGLFTTFSPRAEGEGRWLNGVKFDAIPCAGIQGISQAYCDPEDMTGLPKVFDSSALVGNATPFTVYADYLCTPIGNDLSYGQDIATQRLIAREEAAVENGLWNGIYLNVPNFSGANGFDPPVTVAAADAEHALAAAEDGIAEGYGSIGVIHLSRATGSLLKNRIEFRGGRAYTLLGTPVAIGAGYPNGEIIGTPALFGYRSEIFTSSNRPGDLLDRGTNDLYAVAERSYLIGFDPCPVVKVTFTP